MNMRFLPGGLFASLLVISTLALHGQTNLAGSASASADSSHLDHPAASAIDGDTLDGSAWGIFAMDTADQEEVNIAPLALATADESSENGPPEAAIDGDTADWTGWAVTATYEKVPHWLELSWETAQSVNRVVLYTNGAGSGAYAMQGYRVQYWDGIVYRDLDTIIDNRSKRITSTFSPAVTKKLRIYCEEPDSASLWYRISEVEVYSSKKVNPHWLELSWEAPQIMNKVLLYTHSAGKGDSALRDYEIRYWDGTAFQKASAVSGNQAAKVTTRFQPVTTSRLRIHCTVPDHASGWYRINELEVYYEPPVPVEIPEHWLELSWDSARTMNRIVLFTNSAREGAFALRAYDIQYLENSDWLTLASVTDNTEAELTSTFEAVSASRIRILCRVPDEASSWYRINEVEVYNDNQTAIEQEVAEKTKDALFVYRDAYTRETVIASPEEIDELRIYSISGILVHTGTGHLGTNSYRIAPGTLPEGAYVAVVNLTNSKQFIIR